MTKMKIRHFLLWTVAFALCAGVFSCKKDKESTTTKKSLVGSPTFTISAYLTPGDVVELVPGEVKTEDGSPAGICWTFSFTSSVRDTVRLENGTGDASTVLTVPDTLNSFTVTCTAFAEDYYNTLATSTVSVVHGQGSLSGMDLPETVTVFEDPRDGRTYPSVEIGGREWFTRNLAFEGGASYHDAAAMQDVFGQFYDWEEAVTGCPEGWRLPDGEDWNALARAAGIEESETGIYPGLAGKLMADVYLNDSKMWEFFPEVKITNELLFCAIPAGYALDAEGSHSFTGSSEYAVFWTAEEVNDEMACCRQLYVASPDVIKDVLHKESFLASVRCVRDIE